MMGVCSLALSSLFIVGNKSVVHADTVSGAQNNAISWDSDSDDSQVMQESQTKTEQAMPQKADNNQQNAVQPVQNNAVTSTVRSVSSVPRIINQTRDVETSSVANNQSSRANLVSKVDSAAPSQTLAQQTPVQITNPNNNQVIVHYVNMRGESIDGVKDGTITINNSTTGHYTLPAGYSLANNQYTVTDEVQRDVPRWHNWAGSEGGRLQDVMTDSEAQIFKSQIQNLINKYSMYGKLSYVHNHGLDNAQLSSNDQRSSIMITMGRNLKGLVCDESFAKQLKSEGITNIVSTALDSSRDHDILFKTMLSERGGNEFDNTVVLYDEIQGFLQDRLHQIYYAMGGTADGTLSGPSPYGGEFNVALDDISNYTFTDNSGQVKKVNGNTINLAVTKPQSVNPATDTRCHSSATRVIHVNFPDGQIPQSYDGIVDSRGDLTQTVHFTRTATEDALTGNILQYGNWTSDNKDHNFIGFEARTLPRIPGYTLSIKPAQA